jgi:hypothetical protein
MRKIAAVSAIILLFLFVLGCAGTRGPEQPRTGLFEIEGTVQSVQGRSAMVLMSYPQLPKGSDIDELAQEVVRKCLLIEGMKTTCDGKQALVREVRGDTVRLEYETPPAIKAGDVLRIAIPKKALAIVDFEVIRGNQKDMGRVTLEGLTGSLIDSGHFVVVEREKLKTVLNELQLSLSGMAQKTPDQVIGNLFVADIILTGTFANVQDDWDIRLRVVSVRTGQAMAAVSKRMKLSPDSELRDSSAFFDDFEAARLSPSWVQTGIGNRKNRNSAFCAVSLDGTQGADNSTSSAKIEFNVPANAKRSFMISLADMKKRDLSLFSGIEFWVKGTEDFNGQFIIDCSQPDDNKKRMRWSGFFPITTGWNKITVPFNSLIVGRKWIRQGAAVQGYIPGDEVLRLHRVEDFIIGIDSERHLDSRGAFWIDKVRFY